MSMTEQFEIARRDDDTQECEDAFNAICEVVDDCGCSGDLEDFCMGPFGKASQPEIVDWIERWWTEPVITE